MMVSCVSGICYFRAIHQNVTRVCIYGTSSVYLYHRRMYIDDKRIPIYWYTLTQPLNHLALVYKPMYIPYLSVGTHSIVLASSLRISVTLHVHVTCTE